MNAKKVITNLLGVVALVFIQSAHADVYDNVNGGSLIVSMSGGNFEMYSNADCNWFEATDASSKFKCKKGSDLPREATGELIMIDREQHYLFIMNGVISEGPKCSRCLVRLNSIKGFNTDAVNVLAVVDYTYEKKRDL